MRKHEQQLRDIRTRLRFVRGRTAMIGISNSPYLRRLLQRAAPPVPPYSLTMVWDPDDRIFVVTVPELPGCRTHGATYEEAAANAREAIASWVGAAEHLGTPPPAPYVERYPLDDDGEADDRDRVRDRAGRARGVA